MRVSADMDLCQGHQMCVVEAPEVFGFDDEADHVRVLVDHPVDEQRDAVALAVRYCPTMALTMTMTEDE